MSAAGPQAAPLGLKAVLALPSFKRLWISQAVSIFGDFLALYAVVAIISFQLHGTPRQVSLITVFFMLPFAIVGPVAGVFVDRWDPRRTMIVSDLVRAVLILGLIFVRAPWHVYAVMFLVSVFSSFFVPSQSVLIPQIVPPEGLLSANAAIQQAVQGVRIVSPALSGALVGWLGASACYYIDSLSFLVSAFMISRIAAPPRPPHEITGVKGVLANLASGMKFILSHPVISFVILSIAAGMFSLGAFGSLSAVYVRDILHMGTYMFGALGSMIGLGMLIGSFVVVKKAQGVENKAVLIVIGLAACGLNIAIIAFASNPIAAVLGCLGIGLSASLLIVPSMAMMQGQVPPEMRGRVSSSSMSLMTLAQGVALLFAGDLASRFGIVPVYYGSGALLVVIALLGLRKALG